MKKTHNANIGGTVFQSEEDAYEQLQAYLQSIETHFLSYPDVAEILSDIEGRIAEQLLERDTALQIVRVIDVERVIAAMGRTEQFADPATDQTAQGPARRLFRDPDQKIIAGVAAGLAAYLGVPPLLVRLALVLLLFFFGTALVVYLLLWALVPMAGSTTDKLQMRGRPLTLASIDQGVRDGIAFIPPGARNMATQGVMAVGSLIYLVVVTIGRVLRRVAGVFVVGGATLGVLILTVLLVMALVNAGAPPLHPDVAAFLASFGTWQHLFKVLVYLLAIIPLTLVITTGLKLFWGVRHLNTRGLTGLLGVWVVSLLATAAIWSSSYPELRRYWDEYPATAEARRGLDRFSALAATASPLSDEQSRALLATLTAEQLRRAQDRYRTYPYRGPDARFQFEEDRIRSRQESNRRVIESARAYLDAQQLALLEDSMTQYITRAQAALQSQQELPEAQDR
jgi:phage shock protein PspC (stress-responsive transcriptional regulator)